MHRHLSTLFLSAALLTGCDSARTTNHSANDRERGGVKVRAPGVNVDVETQKGAKDRKIEVDVKPPPKE